MFLITSAGVRGSVHESKARLNTKLEKSSDLVKKIRLGWQKHLVRGVR